MSDKKPVFDYVTKLGDEFDGPKSIKVFEDKFVYTSNPIVWKNWWFRSATKIETIYFKDIRSTELSKDANGLGWLTIITLNFKDGTKKSFELEFTDTAKQIKSLIDSKLK